MDIESTSDNNISPTHKYSYKYILREVTNEPISTVRFLQKHSVLASSKECPGPKIPGKHLRSGCGHSMALKETSDRRDKLVWRCRKIHKYVDNEKHYCAKDIKVSIRDETWLSESKLSLATIVELIYLWSNNFSNCDIMNEVNISHKTLVEWTYYFREAVTTYVFDISQQIGGEGIEVEIDESKFGKRKYHKGHPVEGQWVFGGREKHDKTKIFMIPVEDRSAPTLIPLIEKWIAKGSIIHSDCWSSYHTLSQRGYRHVTVNHSKQFVNWKNGACTNAIESDWRHAKVSMPKYGIHNGLHHMYLGEFMWRRRFADKDKFPELIKILNTTFQKKYMTSIP